MYCSKCGNRIVDGARFCEQCGWEVGASVASPQDEPVWLTQLKCYIPKFSLALAWRGVLLIAGLMLIPLVIHYFEIYSANAEYNMYLFSSYEGGAGASQLFTAIPYIISLAVILVFMGLISTKVDTEYLAFAFIWFAPHFMAEFRSAIDYTNTLAEAGLYRALVYSSAADKTDAICRIVLVLLIIVLVLKFAEEFVGEKAEKGITDNTRTVKIFKPANIVKSEEANIVHTQALAASSEGNSDQRFAKKVGRLADKLSTINNSADESVQNTWKCKYCGFINDKTQDCCKSCGKYK